MTATSGVAGGGGETEDGAGEDLGVTEEDTGAGTTATSGGAEAEVEVEAGRNS